MNFVSNDNATSLFTAIGNRFRKRPPTFTGTQAEWNALTAVEKEQYDIVNITNDYDPAGGGGHTIEDAEGTELTQRDVLQVGGSLIAEDDSVNEKTIITNGRQTIEYDDWIELTPQEQAAIPEAVIINAPESASGTSGGIRYDKTSQWVQLLDDEGWFNWRKAARALWDWIVDNTPFIRFVPYQGAYGVPSITRTNDYIEVRMTSTSYNYDIANAIFQSYSDPITVHVKGHSNNLVFDSDARYFYFGYCDWDGSSYSNVVRSVYLPANGQFEFDVVVPANKYLTMNVSVAYAADRYVIFEEFYAVK